ncbi:hypothetical protein CBR_g30561 [Chara braunii]|uniref:Reverse transcriptase n=1 Tax=Chara braunii TaxID=69332 RepID=A0A388LCZ6_CHABU|nr:hypothetical protein CBR_g30561 [Chara braunii]|eukprot:GBG80195.1 hypothetical protein CBR_g30561 [Chara braunii]
METWPIDAVPLAGRCETGARSITHRVTRGRRVTSDSGGCTWTRGRTARGRGSVRGRVPESGSEVDTGDDAAQPKGGDVSGRRRTRPWLLEERIDLARFMKEDNAMMQMASGRLKHTRRKREGIPTTFEQPSWEEMEWAHRKPPVACDNTMASSNLQGAESGVSYKETPGGHDSSEGGSRSGASAEESEGLRKKRRGAMGKERASDHLPVSSMERVVLDSSMVVQERMDMVGGALARASTEGAKLVATQVGAVASAITEGNDVLQLLVGVMAEHRGAGTGMRGGDPREREAAAAARAVDIADQVALLRIPEANADRFQEELAAAAAVAALVRLRNLEDLESRVTALEQRNQELQAKGGVELTFFKLLINRQYIHVLIDSGSTTNFFSPNGIRNASLGMKQVELQNPCRTQVGNQEVVTSTHAVKGVRITFDKDRTVTHRLNFYVLDKCPFDAVIGLSWLKAHCLRTTWADNQFVVLDVKGNERTVLLDETRESPVTLLSANKFCRSVRRRKEAGFVHIALVKPFHVPFTFAAFSTSEGNSTSTTTFVPPTSAVNDRSSAEPNISKPVVIAVNSQSDFLSPDKDDPPPEIPANIRHLLDRFPEVLAEPRGVPERPVKHKIEIIEGSVPPKGCVYRMGQGELEELRRQIDDMIDRGWIRPSESEFGAPVLFVPKKGGKLRMCIDYRGFNRITRKNVYPLPRIDDLLDAAGGCKVFSKIDLKSGYHQIEVDPSDQHKTAFKTRDGLYEFIVMPFGLTNAPATFQTLMDKVLHHQLNRFVVVYLDDILIFGKSMEEHVKHLEEVLQVLRDAQLHLNLEKSEFGRDSVIYLGHRLSASGLEPEATKVEVIRNWPQPTNYLTCLVDSYDLRRKLKEDLVEHTAKDSDLSPILEQLKADPNSQPDFHECEGLVFRRYGKFDCLCVPNHAPLRTHFLDLAPGRSGHFGFEKTYGSLLQQFDWPGMKGSAQKFIVECQVCQRIKVHRHKPYGLLRPLPIPNGPGESISIDFTDMGKVSEAGNSQIMVIVNRFYKFLNLIPLPPHAPTELVIEEFHQQYIMQSGVPKTIVSDRDTRFISKDWKDFTSQIYDIKLNRTSGRHPEANGLAEDINQNVIQLLRALIVPDQNTWDKELHKVKGLYNNSIHSATGVIPNQLQYGWPMRNPLSYLFPERSPGLMPGMPGYDAKYARLLKAATTAMNKRQHAMIKHANKLCKEEKFKIGDYVWVKMFEFSDEEGISRKLLPLYYGPWQILKVVGDDFGPSYVIDVPPHLRTYSVFHASKLFQYIDDETFPFRDPMIPRPINDGHEIDRIVSHEGIGRSRQYKVHFLYHPLNEFFWIDRKELIKSAPRVVNAYERQIVDG